MVAKDKPFESNSHTTHLPVWLDLHACAQPITRGRCLVRNSALEIGQLVKEDAGSGSEIGKMLVLTLGSRKIVSVVKIRSTSFPLEENKQ